MKVACLMQENKVQWNQDTDGWRKPMNKHQHIVKKVLPGSIAEELEIEAGDKILAIDNTEIEDIFDYQFLVQDTYIEMLIEKPDG